MFCCCFFGICGAIYTQQPESKRCGVVRERENRPRCRSRRLWLGRKLVELMAVSRLSKLLLRVIIDDSDWNRWGFHIVNINL